MSDFRESEWDYGLEPGESFEPQADEVESFDLSEPHVMTVLGPVDPGALGFTLHHEHLICHPPGEDIDQDLVLDDVAKAASELEGYFATGGRTIVDMTTAEFGRNADDLLWIAQHVPVHVVATTGVWELANWGDSPLVESLADVMAAELTSGIDRTSARAGVICAGPNDSVLHAAVLAHRMTGAPISVESGSGLIAPELLSSLLDGGVPAMSVVIGIDEHVEDISILHDLANVGAFLSFRHWTVGTSDLDAVRVSLIAELVREGFADRILVSGGIARKSSMLSYGGGPGFVHFIDLLPIQLMEAGLSARDVRRIFFENPAEALTNRGPVITA